MIRFLSPTTILLPEDTPAIRRLVTFRDRSVDYQLSRMRRNVSWMSSDPEGFAAAADKLRAERDRCLAFETPEGLATYSGLVHKVDQWLKVGVDRSALSYPEPRLLPWASKPFELRPYQKEAVQALIGAKHGAACLPTASGKSAIVMQLLHDLGLRAVVMAPSASITKQLYSEAQRLFGRARVGMYGAGRHDTDKLITFAVSQALVRVEPGIEAWEKLSQAQVFIADEAHQLPAETFSKVCFGLMSGPPYRFSLTATHTRTDGSELLLEAITGPVVYRKSYAELAQAGWLAPLRFRMMTVDAVGRPNQQDPMKETRNQLLNNPNVNATAARVAAAAVKAGRQVLILIDEFRQFNQLMGHMSVPFEFAHGGASQDAKEYLPSEYWRSDVSGIIERFNSGQTKVVIGTSAISTGVDTRPVGCLIYLQGGTSEIQVKQALGRGTRLHPSKTDCWVVDFVVRGSNTMERHAAVRQRIYAEYAIEGGIE